MLIILSVLKFSYLCASLFTRTLENWHVTIAKSLIQIQHTLVPIQDFPVITSTHSLLDKYQDHKLLWGAYFLILWGWGNQRK